MFWSVSNPCHLVRDYKIFNGVTTNLYVLCYCVSKGKKKFACWVFSNVKCQLEMITKQTKGDIVSWHYN